MKAMAVSPYERAVNYTKILLQAQSLTVTPLTVTVGYSDTFSVSQTITNDLEAVIVTNMRLE